MGKSGITATRFYKEASDSIQSNFETGGAISLVKNNYFLIILSASVSLIVLSTFAVIYERKAMPITQKNFSQVIDHIDFIEKAFIIEELETMTKNPREFLDYRLVDPMDKMGFEFEATFRAICTEFLDDELSSGELQIIQNYLEIAAQQGSKLYENNFISEDTNYSLRRFRKN